MKPQPILVASAILLMGLGAVTLFAPDELATLVGTTGEGSGAMVMQLLGGALFALGFLDWMNRFATIGGIYGRPVVAANLAFFFIAATTFARRALRVGPDVGAGPLLWGALALSGLLALGYGRIMFASPRAQAVPGSSSSAPGGES